MRWILAAVTFALGMSSLDSAPASARPSRPAAELGLQGNAKTPSLKLRADQLTYGAARGCGDACGSRLDLAGGVELELGQLRLRSARARVDLDSAGNPSELQADGGVTLELRGRSGRAQTVVVRLDGARKAVMSGDARLQVPRLGFALRGSRIELDLVSGKLSVREARLETAAVPDAR